MKRNGKRQFNHAEWVELKRRYRYRCVRCGRKENVDDASSRLTVDHVVPVALGGSRGIGNVQPLCLSCNSWKGMRIIDFRDRKFKY